MKHLIKIGLLVVSLSGVAFAQAPSATPTAAASKDPKQLQKQIDTLEAQVLSLQKVLSEKDAALAQLLGENSQLRGEQNNAKITALTRRLITDAGGNPDKDQWDFQTMSLKVATPAPAAKP